MAKKKKLPTYRTPVGQAKFPKLTEPDTKWDAAGAYSVKLLFEEGSAEANDLAKKIDEAHAAAVASYRAELSDRAAEDMKAADKPYTYDTDGDGEETGFTKFSFKMKASGTNKKTNKPWTMRPGLFNAKGDVLDLGIQIWGGTKMRVAYQIAPFYTKLVGAGVSLRLEAVQVIDLVGPGQKSADQYGFGEEEGYDGDGAPESAVSGSPESFEGPTAGDDGQGDF